MRPLAFAYGILAYALFLVTFLWAIGSMARVLKTTVYLTDLSTFALMNEVYEEFFTPPYPARATVGVRALPKGVMVEIDAIAAVE